MLFIKNILLKRRPKKEYLDDKYKPRKAASLIWLKRIILFLLILISAAFLLSLGKQAYANSGADKLTQVSIDKISEGSLLIKTSIANQYQQIPLLKTDVEMDISGMIVRSKIKQYFKNTSQSWIEAIYVFPLPSTAAVDHLRMQIGERIIVADIKEKHTAKKLYQKAKRSGYKAALVEQQRPNLFTNSVANIAPGETVMIEIEYQQTLKYEQGEFSLRFPMTITPRYIPGKTIQQNISITESGWAQNTDQVRDASRITPPMNVSTDKINPLSINIKLNAGFPLQSLQSRYHKIIKNKKNNITYISLAKGVTASDHDFELLWKPQIDKTPKAAVFNERVNGENYQMIMLMPPENKTQNIQPLARQVTYIIDTSGSMHGVSISQAKQALLMALERLRLHDKFNIIQFNSVTQQIFNQPQLASFENIIFAKKYVNALEANGGTEMAAALNLALNQASAENHVHQIIFLTDGSVGNENALFDIIHNKLGKSRLFTIGIGSAPNSYFMRKAAQFGRGSFTLISDVNEVKEKMTSLFTKLESPLMTDISFHIEDGLKTEIWPQRISDLYAGEPIILAIKSDKALNTINIKGRRALTPWSAKLNLKNQKTSKGIATFWARKKITALTDSLHNGANKEQVRSEIIKLALKHHLVSQHTSLLAIDKTPIRPQKIKLSTQAIPLNLPRGQSTQQSFGRLAQTASSAEINLLFGFSLLMLYLAVAVLLGNSTASNTTVNTTRQTTK